MNPITSWVTVSITGAKVAAITKLTKIKETKIEKRPQIIFNFLFFFKSSQTKINIPTAMLITTQTKSGVNPTPSTIRPAVISVVKDFSKSIRDFCKKPIIKPIN